MDVLSLLMPLLLAQAAPVAAVKPVIDNPRVVVWDQSTPPPEITQMDSVRIQMSSGKAVFVPKGRGTAGALERTVFIGLKDHPPSTLENKSGYPIAFPRPGVVKILENNRVIVWDYTWTTGVPTPVHFHDKDVVVTYLENGTLQSTTPDGKKVDNPYEFGMIRFNLANRTHTETLTKGKQRAIIMELK